MDYSFLDNSSVLITGATGSFGQKCVRTILGQTSAKRVIIFSRDELKQSQMQQHIADPDKRLRYFIGDVRDLERLQRAFSSVDYVLHAAALKQVPAMEYNPFEAIKTNILGTQNVINAALDQKVKKVILISTDKAANPANLYGATKLCAEKLMVSANVYSGKGGTKFSVVRYGNVLGSRGSLLKVIEAHRGSGKIPVTNIEMTRFWITLDQGITFVINSLARMQGGEIYIPKIPSMRISEFISCMAPECELEVVGIRPGEKLHEVLVTPEEARHAREFENGFVILPEHDWSPDQHYSEFAAVPEGFHYSSANNPEWLTNDALKRLVSSL